MKTVLKAPGTKRLKLKCDEPLSNFAFKFNLRRYIKVTAGSFFTCVLLDTRAVKVGRCSFLNR
jgi:hypothetical protein